MLVFDCDEMKVFETLLDRMTLYANRISVSNSWLVHKCLFINVIHSME